MSPISSMMASQSAELPIFLENYIELPTMDLQLFQFVAAGRLNLPWIDISLLGRTRSAQ